MLDCQSVTFMFVFFHCTSIAVAHLILTQVFFNTSFFATGIITDCYVPFFAILVPFVTNIVMQNIANNQWKFTFFDGYTFTNIVIYPTPKYCSGLSLNCDTPVGPLVLDGSGSFARPISLADSSTRSTPH